MNIWAVVNQKGGSGKSTLTVNLAAAAVNAGYTVSVIDTDPQISASVWHDTRLRLGFQDLGVVATPHRRLEQSLDLIRKADTDLVIIDTPPFADASAAEAIKFATQILIPCSDHIFDLIALSATFKLVKLYAPGQVPLVVLNRTNSRSKSVVDASAESISAQAGAEGISIVMSPYRLNYRKAFPDALARGKSVVEMLNADAYEAKREVERIFEYACERDNLPKRDPA